MKKFSVITGFVVATVIASCDGPRRNPGRAYMPDMAYSTAYETYAESEERLKNSSAEGPVHFTGKPVDGTVARGELMHYDLPNDSTGYAQSASFKSPLDLATIDMKESERLYLVNCGICHGTKLDGNGPLFNNGNGPYVAKPATLVGDANIEKLSEGTIYHVSTYGKNAMGSYASQLTSKQRWMVAAYIKSKQSGGKTPAAVDSAGAVKPDSATAPKAVAMQ
jgi:mono/diheme cytochrome c family protein